MHTADLALPTAWSTTTASRGVLIVDDDPAVLEALSTALSPQFRIVTARTGAEALEALGQCLLDLVLLDNVLPDIPGLTILGIIKRYLPSLPVVLITGYGTEEISIGAFRGGVGDYVKKPIQVGDLMARIDHILHARRRAGEAHAPHQSAGIRTLQVDQEDFTHNRLRRALAFIAANLHTHLSLEQVGREAGMSKFHFCRQFKAVMGMSFREFLARRRIERASVLLRDLHLSVTEVYLEVGFKDLSHFTRVFRKFTGLPPSRFRLVDRDASRLE
jgi:YesN/AraC family two-component response regulator